MVIVPAMNKIKSKPQGFMALMSILVISAISLVIAVTLNLTVVWESLLITEQNNNLNAYYLAHSCAEEGLLRIRRDINYTDGTILIDTQNSCKVSILNSNGVFILTATGESYENTQQLEVTFLALPEFNLRDEFNVTHTRYNLNILTWEKI